MNKVILMYSSKYKRDMWWIVSGENYTGPYQKRHQADEAMKKMEGA